MMADATMLLRLSTVKVNVKFANGRYSAWHGRTSASCTWSDAQAVRRVAKKLGYKPGFDVLLVGRDREVGRILWLIVDVQPTRANRKGMRS